MSKEAKDPNRKLESSLESDGSILITESTAYVPMGYWRKKWNRDTVRITMSELYELTRLYPMYQPESNQRPERSGNAEFDEQRLNEWIVRQKAKRPKNFADLSSREQWDIDKRLGILDY